MGRHAQRRRRLSHLSRSHDRRLVHRRHRRLTIPLPNYPITQLPNYPIVYVELHTSSAFSFLQAASLPEALVDRAADLGYPALALLDRDGVYGAPRFHKAALAAGLRPIIGAELTITGAGQAGQAGEAGWAGRAGRAGTEGPEARSVPPDRPFLP